MMMMDDIGDDHIDVFFKDSDLAHPFTNNNHNNNNNISTISTLDTYMFKSATRNESFHV